MRPGTYRAAPGAGFHAPIATPAGSDDALLRGAGVDPAALELASGMEDSHLAVACGVGDAGIGIEAAAAAFGLGFVPLAQERYAFVCHKPALEHPAVRALRALLAGPAWATQLAAMPGYAADQPGRVLRLTEALPWWDEIVGAPQRHAARPRCSDPRLGHRWEHREARRFMTLGATACAAGPARCSRAVTLHACS